MAVNHNVILSMFLCKVKTKQTIENFEQVEQCFNYRVDCCNIDKSSLNLFEERNDELQLYFQFSSTYMKLVRLCTMQIGVIVIGIEIGVILLNLASHIVSAKIP